MTLPPLNLVTASGDGAHKAEGNTVRQIIFDLDGTLIDSEYEIAKITSDLVHDRGGLLDTKAAFCNYAGMSFKDKFNSIASTDGRFFSAPLLADMHVEYTNRKKAMYRDPNLPMVQGAKALLDRLATNPYVVLSLGSSNETPRSKAILSNIGLSGYFGDRVYGSDMTGGRKKPDPAIFLTAMADRNPRDFVIVEDSIVGVEAAHAAGAFVVAHIDPRMGVCKAREKAYLKAGANVIIQDYNNFEKVVDTAWRGWSAPRPSQEERGSAYKSNLMPMTFSSFSTEPG